MTPTAPPPAGLFDQVEAPPPVGHNNPPPYNPEDIAAFDRRMREFAETNAQWAALKEIEDENQARHLADYLAGARKLAGEIEAWRVKAKAPHLEAGKAVDAAAEGPKDIMQKAIAFALRMTTVWQNKQAAIAEKKADEDRRKAAALKAEADRLAAQAMARHDLVGMHDAEAMQKESAQIERAAERGLESAGRVQSASGGGRTIASVTVKHVRIDNPRLAFIWLQGDPTVMDAMQRVATARVRAKNFDGQAPGCTVTETKEAR